MSPSNYKPNGPPKLTGDEIATPKYTTKSNAKTSTLDSIKRHSLSRSSDDLSGRQSIKISNIIGDFGPYQIAVLMFSALRAMCCSMDGLSGPFLSPNVKHFRCDNCLSNNATLNAQSECAQLSTTNSSVNLQHHQETSQCFYLKQDNNANTILNSPCTKWSFEFEQNKDLMSSLTVEQGLVCDREWLKSVANSMYFVGATLGLLFWGFVSDKYGRKTAYVYSHITTLIFGFSSLFATNMKSYIILRMINSFGMIGELVPRSIVVETVAAKYRFICSVVCQTGWATGIILVPLLSYINPSYRFILSVPVVISALMLPWLYFLPESARWLMINSKFQRARSELIKASKINGKFDENTSSLILQFNNQVLREEVSSGARKSRLGIWRSILAIFTNIQLLKNTMSVFLLLFVAEVVYFSLTLNVADLGGSMHLNYIVSGFSEFLSIAMCGLMLAYFSRRMCLSVLLLESTISYLLMAVANAYEESLSIAFILGINAFGKITAIGNLMVIILVSQEVFPTVIRQFGTSLCITVGKLGSAVAPFTHELGQSIGQSYCFGMFSLICFSCAFVPLGLSETGCCELPDTVVDIENGVAMKEAAAKTAKGNSVHPCKKPAAITEDVNNNNNNNQDENNNNNNDSTSVRDLNEKPV